MDESGISGDNQVSVIQIAQTEFEFGFECISEKTYTSEFFNWKQLNWVGRKEGRVHFENEFVFRIEMSNGQVYDN
jgi:hypothetical protein